MKNASDDAGLTDRRLEMDRQAQGSRPETVWLLVDEHGRPAMFKLGGHRSSEGLETEPWLWLTRREPVVVLFLAKDDALKFATDSQTPKEVVCTAAD